MLSRRIPQCRQCRPTGPARLLTAAAHARPQFQPTAGGESTTATTTTTLCRPFSTTQPAHLLPQTTRPQLPFLTTTTIRPSPWSSTHLRQHFRRLVSTESRDYYRRRISRGLRIGLSFYAILVLFQVVRLGLYQEGIEQRWPTPAEWSWKCRWCLRSARALMHPEEIGKLMTNWPMVAGYLRELIEILEAEVDVVEGGIDVEGKSPEWKRGYFLALISAAKAAENLDGWVTDRKQKISAPGEYVVGPSNPRPTPMPAGQTKVPREEDCEPASDSPASFYSKILTTKGFDVDQRVDAALAYADWLGYMGLSETEFEMYQWALDIAVDQAGGNVDRRGVLDAKSQSQSPPSENLLRVSTALGVHHAKRGDLSTALSVFTSVLRARDLPASSSKVSEKSSEGPSRTNEPISTFTTLKNMIFGAPPSPHSSTEQNEKTSACATAALKTYIGEIIYATSSREAGLAWTRDAVETAESLLSPFSSSTAAEKEACTDCLKVALQNWQTMLEKLIARAEADELAAGNGWFSSPKNKKDEKERWIRERDVLEHKIRRVAFDDLGGGLSGGLAGQGLFV